MLALTDFGALHYDLIGPKGAPVVCMLHSLTSDSGMWAEQVPVLLAQGYRVLRLDARGHGGSSASSPGDYRIEMLAQDVLGVLDRLGIDAVHLVGLSLGGMIGQVIAADHPARILSLAACATNPRWIGDTEMLLRRMDAVRASGTLDSIVDAAMEQRYSPAYKVAHPLRWAALRETFLGTRLDGYFGCMHAVLNHDVSQRLATVKAPTIVISGSDDVVTPPTAGRAIAAGIAGARYHEIAGGRHFLNVEFAEEFNRVLLGWLAEQVG
ncbi:MAG: alpha/beta fold hydrolase [Rhizobiaceae bacterium]|nr:alpha/beta fold hydrolase [Rhizobiaceae bacterium]